MKSKMISKSINVTKESERKRKRKSEKELKKSAKRRRKSFERRMKKGNMSYDSIGKWEKYIQKTNLSSKYPQFKNHLISSKLKPKKSPKKRSQSENPPKTIWKAIEIKEKITKVKIQRNFFVRNRYSKKQKSKKVQNLST